MDFYKKLNEGLLLGEIVKIQWNLTGEDTLFNPERVAVRMEDADGKVFELVLHKSYPNWYSQESMIIYMILVTHGLFPKGKLWIDVDLVTAVNQAKRPMISDFETNAWACAINPWEKPYVRF